MIGPNGEKRPADVIANAVPVAKIATGKIEEEYVDPAKRRAGAEGGRKRAKTLSPAERSELARKAARERWKRRGLTAPAR